jgi:pyruvate/2-oxoglutarate dehydrogenase complex dihydrolipoamide dehydrogenase (E3) component
MIFDAIVIGSGQAGNPLSHRLVDHGWKVALVEKSQLGGTCINTGCTPTKTLVASAQVAFYARNASRWGVRTSDVSVDLPAVVARKNAVVQRFRGGQQRNVDKRPDLRLFRGQARFLGSQKLQVGGEVIESSRIFINAGTRPDPPRLDGLDLAGYLTNESLMELQQLPEHLIVLGGGYIGLEFGQMFSRFGSRVTLVHRGNQLLPHEDFDVAQELRKVLEAEGIDIRLNAAPVRAQRQGDRIAVTVAVQGQEQIVYGSHILAATGRRPNSDTLDLQNAGVEVDSHGYIKVNDRLETNVPGIWALGDIKGGPAFTHISYNDFQVVYANLIEGKDLSIRDRYLPYSLFTDPQLGRVGLTEKEARASGRNLKIGTYPMSYVARAIERDETAGFMKLIVDAANDKILGAAILGIEGGELVQILGALMLAGAPYTVLKGAVYIHPTLAEGFFGLMEAVQPVN